MRLRTLAGAYAGEIREYSFSAAMAALKTGTAERLDVPVPVRRAEPPKPVMSGHKLKRSR